MRAYFVRGGLSLGLALMCVWVRADDSLRAQRELAGRAVDAGRPRNQLAARLEGPGVEHRLGQSWWVAVAWSSNAMARKTSVQGQRASVESELSVYRFEVTDVTVRGTQVRVERSGEGRQGEALWLELDRSGQVTQVRGPRIGAGLDYFPFRVPGPSVLSGAGVGRARSYRTHDRLARPIDVVWRDGDPWPSYVKAPAGVAVLLQEAP